MYYEECQKSDCLSALQRYCLGSLCMFCYFAESPDPNPGLGISLLPHCNYGQREKEMLEPVMNDAKAQI